ncbi:MAG: RpiB/LacA/LacB family sugar-phosphate isomerase, partial [Candidatus Hydrogenedentes bacterium]|nr:RpiB/LacA/LacB family sugar-phosphate isomerase [Candidatus Hydrogenedentota bacterium]
ANVLCLGKRVLTLDQCKAFVDLWLKTPFGGGERHQRRIAKLG